MSPSKSFTQQSQLGEICSFPFLSLLRVTKKPQADQVAVTVDTAMPFYLTCDFHTPGNTITTTIFLPISENKPAKQDIPSVLTNRRQPSQTPKHFIVKLLKVDLLFSFTGGGLEGKGGDKSIRLLRLNFPLRGRWNNWYPGLRDHGLEEKIRHGTGNEEMPARRDFMILDPTLILIL